MTLPLLVVIFLSSWAVAQTRTRCFECYDVPYPSLCNIITTCPINYKCSVEKIVTSGGLVLYNSGCQPETKCSANRKRNIPQYPLTRSLSPSDNITCSECCDGEFCNIAGCGQTALNQPKRGPLCFQCDYMTGPQNCRHVGQCQLGDVCMLNELRQHAPSGGQLFRSSCMAPQKCRAYALIGRKRAAPHCHVCCHDDYCNDRCPTTTT